MCGIIGQVEFQGQVDHVHFEMMRDTLAHRGPDGAGTWVSDDGRVFDLKQNLCDSYWDFELQCFGTAKHFVGRLPGDFIFAGAVV